MPKPRTENGDKNLIHQNLIILRKEKGLSQRELAEQLQLRGCDIDKNVITRIETNKRFVADLELKALADFFRVSCETLMSDNPSRSSKEKDAK